ncbi:MAG: ferritin-like domain-containing protein [Planctomycetes bacterium]|nr:ferritin-like domain-containing protein [Planctomycetota bacterium]
MASREEDRAARAPAALFDDLDEALRSEFGARVIYGLLARSERDEELARLFATLADEQHAQIERLRSLIVALGGRARAACRRRTVLAHALHAFRFVGGRKFALRLCHDAQASLEYRYHGVGRYLAAIGTVALAESAGTLATTKGRHARALLTWLEHGDHPAGPPRRR